jgi:hypothetical protein
MAEYLKEKKIDSYYDYLKLIQFINNEFGFDNHIGGCGNFLNKKNKAINLKKKSENEFIKGLSFEEKQEGVTKFLNEKIYEVKEELAFSYLDDSEINEKNKDEIII